MRVEVTQKINIRDLKKWGFLNTSKKSSISWTIGETSSSIEATTKY